MPGNSKHPLNDFADAAFQWGVTVLAYGFYVMAVNSGMPIDKARKARNEIIDSASTPRPD